MIFRNYVIQNFPFLEDDFDALTDYELFCKMIEYMKKSLDKIKDYQVELDSFKEQLDYFQHYFDNLDLQEEVDKKLDEMYENGQLQSLIEQFIDLSVTFCYNTVADMCEATNLINGSKAKTYGFYSLNDGGGATYKIRTITNDDVIDNIKIFAMSDNTLVAELIIDNKMSVKQFGAKGDGENDDTLSFKACIDNVRKVYIPSTEDYYLVSSTIDLKSNQTIYGDGESSVILMSDDLEESIFNINEEKDITIEKIKLCNESCQSGSSPDLAKNILISTNDVEDLTIQNCFFENAYSKGIEIFKTKNFNYINNTFKNATYDMLLLLPECENVVVDNCIFDTIVSTYINTYLFATGRNDTETYSFSCKNVTVKNSKFLNNPNWEGIDTHGCNGFYCENNYVENCKIGIVATYGSTAPVTSDTVKHGDIYIKNNILVKPATDQTYGISAGVSTNEFLCKNVHIEDNYIDGYGASNTQGAIHLIGIKYSNITNNYILNSQGAAMEMTSLLYSEIIGNKCININANYGINYQGGCWFINFKNNTIKNTTFSNTISFGIRTSLLNISQFVDNDITATNRYQTNGTIMNGVIGSGTTQIGRIGCYAKNEYGLVTHYCTNTVIRPANTETLSSVSLTGTSSTNEVTGTNSIYYLTEGEEITLQGAGTGGTDLTTVITEFINRDTFKVADTIQTSFSNQNPKTTAGTWVSV